MVLFSILLRPFMPPYRPAFEGAAEERTMKHTRWEERKKRFKTEQEDCQKEMKNHKYRNEAGITIIFIKKKRPFLP